MKKFILFSFLLAIRSYASVSDVAVATAAVGVATGGVLAGSQHALYQTLLREELSGWKEDEIDSTAQLVSSCGVNAEFHLVGNHSQNYLLLTLMNQTPEQVIVLYTDITFRYNDSGNRFPGWSYQPSDYAIDPAWWVLNYVPLPTKEEMRDYKTLEALVPIYKTKSKERCVLKARFTKSKVIFKEEMTYSIFEFNFEGGPSISQSGSMRKLGKPETLIGLDMSIFITPNHAVGFNLLTEREFDGSSKTAITDEFTKKSSYNAEAQSLSLHYLYRHYLTDNFSLNYQPGIGYESIRDEDKEDPTSDSDVSNSFAFVQRLFINYRPFYAARFPNYALSFNVGLGLAHVYVPRGSIGGENIDGHRFGGIFRLGMGF